MRSRAVLVAAVLLAMAGSSVVLASHDPDGNPHVTVGRARGSLTAGQVITYKFPGTYPAWVQTAFSSSLEVNYPSSTYNNSNRPTLAGPSATGTAQMWYSSSLSSPCSGSTGWVQCARNWTTTSLEIFIRNFDAAPLGGLGWYEKNGNCTGYTACHYAKRALIHEIGHALGSLDHDNYVTSNLKNDPEGRTWTVMGAYNPCQGSSSDCDDETNWNWPYFLECDEAAFQLLWDVASLSGPYSTCFENVPGHAANGNLRTTLTTSGTAFTQCTANGSRSVSGRLAIYSDTTNYGPLAGNSLAGRSIRLDRKISTASTWTPNVQSATATTATGNNWTMNISYPGTLGLWNYRVHFDGDSGLASTGTVSFTINWVTTPCPLSSDP